MDGKWRIDCVYSNGEASAELGWQPRDDFCSIVAPLKTGGMSLDPQRTRSEPKGCHDRTFGGAIPGGMKSVDEYPPMR